MAQVEAEEERLGLEQAQALRPGTQGLEVLRHRGLQTGQEGRGAGAGRRRTITTVHILLWYAARLQMKAVILIGCNHKGERRKYRHKYKQMKCVLIQEVRIKR